MLGPLGVDGDLAGQFDTHARDRVPERRQVVPAEVLPLSVGEKEDGVVRAGMPLDRDAVEALLDGGLQCLVQVGFDATAASVRMKPSMVARFGPIMAAPLAKPVTVNPGNCRVAILIPVSVVRMACAA